MNDVEDVERVAEAFAALANPLRVRILLALAETRRPNWDHRGMRYGDLRSAVDVDDGGRFNYHLDELRGEYVASDDGHYWLTATGARVVDDVFAGVFGATREPREGPVDVDCAICGRALRVGVRSGLLSAECPEHGRVFDMPLESPHAAVDHELEALLAWTDRRAMWYHESVSRDVCPHCGASLGDADFEAVADPSEAGPEDESSADGGDVLAAQTCPRCGIAFRVPAEVYAMLAPATGAFAYDHGIEAVTGASFARQRVSVSTTLRGDTVSVRFEAGDERLTVDLDRSLDVVGTAREATTPE